MPFLSRRSNGVFVVTKYKRFEKFFFQTLFMISSRIFALNFADWGSRVVGLEMERGGSN